jgi:mxaK protein
MGNLYLQQAIETAEKMGIDRATALADVAKDLYKSALKKDPEFWAAKYNFEAAQRLSRDLPLGDLQESGEAQESSEELWSAMPGFPLGLP